MACGTPVVASENPGSVDVLDGGSCGLMPADADFAGAVSTLLANETRRAELSAAGLRRAREFSLTGMLDGYEKLLFELTGVHAKSMASV
jgi:glycosyltransferase involved in cell wall biosynthesis